MRKTGGNGRKGSDAPAVWVFAGNSEVGRGWMVESCLVLQLEDAEGTDAWILAEKLVGELPDVKW